MARLPIFNQEKSKEFRIGVNQVCDAAGSTLGAGGKPVIISSACYGHMPVVTKDGVTVVRSFFLDDEIENTGVMMVRNAAETTLKDAGDGTTTCVVLCQSMINAGMDAIASGANLNEVKSGMEKAVTSIVNSLKEMAIPITDNATLKSVATIAANNDEEIGGKLADAYEKIGSKGLLTIEKSKTPETYVVIKDGSEMQSGYSNDKFVTNTEKMIVEYNDPLILVVNYEIKTMKSLHPFLIDFTKVYGENGFREHPLIIIAKGFDGEPYNTFVVNKEKGGNKVCLIQAPNAYQIEALTDIATITGAKLISDDRGLKIESAMASDLGKCQKIVISKSSTLITEGAGDKAKIESLKARITQEMEATENVQLKEILENRLARLSGSIGIIYVGGATAIEQKEREDRVDDANRAVKSAIEEGIVPGGGIALIRAAQSLDMSFIKDDSMFGYEIIEAACYAPLKKMIANAGINEAEVLPVVSSESGNKGYNIRTGKFVDMVKSNIIDPAKVVRCALQNAASVAAQIISSDVMLVELRNKD